jgi:hypothetical protein
MASGALTVDDSLAAEPADDLLAPVDEHWKLSEEVEERSSWTSWFSWKPTSDAHLRTAEQRMLRCSYSVVFLVVMRVIGPGTVQ